MLRPPGREGNRLPAGLARAGRIEYALAPLCRFALSSLSRSHGFSNDVHLLNHIHYRSLAVASQGKSAQGRKNVSDLISWQAYAART